MLALVRIEFNEPLLPIVRQKLVLEGFPTKDVHLEKDHQNATDLFNVLVHNQWL